MSSLKVLRHEIKFTLSKKDMLDIKHKMKDVLTIDRDIEGYSLRSLYFDSINDIDYHEKQAGDLNRKKIRLRIYDPNSDFVKLELKAKHDSHQLKESLIINKKCAKEIIKGNYDVLLNYDDEIATKIYLILRQNCYRPKTIVEYNRIAFISPNNTRITLDFDIKCARYVDDNFFDEKINYIDIINSTEAVLEVKFNNFLEDYIKVLLAKYISDKESFSKYAMSRNKEG